MSEERVAEIRRDFEESWATQGNTGWPHEGPERDHIRKMIGGSLHQIFSLLKHESPVRHPELHYGVRPSLTKAAHVISPPPATEASIRDDFTRRCFVQAILLMRTI